MSTKLEKLFFAIGVQDSGASSKVAKLQANIENMTKKVEDHFKSIGTSVAGVVGSVLAIKGVADPAIELNRALAEVGSLGVDDSALAKLQTAAGSFAFTYGGAATDVVRASYDIQSAIAGLSGSELASFTTAGGVLAKATKADVGTVTAYLGTMYGIYEETARDMGKAAWVNQLAGRTAYAVQIFKTSGSEMSSAFTALGANAEAAGIHAAEQMAVLGMLQSTMSGSEAGGKYKAYLSGVGQAQKELGLKFTDSQGNMLGMVDVLDKIRGKFGETLTVAQADQLKKAFGSDEAVSLIKLMLKQTGSLKKNISDIGNIKGMEHAERMAKRQTDAFHRFSGALGYVHANFMQKLLPTLERWTNKATAHLDTLNKWITKYPNVARVVGYCVLAVLALAGVAGLVTAGFHLFKLSGIALGVPFRALITLVKTLSSGFIKLGATMLANPIILVIVLIAVAIGLVIYYWQDLKAYFADTTWGKPILWVMECLEEKWNMLTDLFTNFTWTKLLKLVITAALTPLEAFIHTIGTIADKLGFDIGKDLLAWKASDFAGSLVDTGAAVLDSWTGTGQSVAEAPALQASHTPLQGNLSETAGQKAAASAHTPVGTGPGKAAASGLQPKFSASAGQKPAELARRLSGAATGKAAVPGLLSSHTALLAKLPEGAAQIELARSHRPEVASLRPAKTLQVQQGGVVGSSLTRVSNTGKTVNINEQHLHFENPPANPDDTLALYMY